jgi:hypothetical protein
MQYTSVITYQYADRQEIDLLTRALKILGFEPKYMALFFDEYEKPIDDISFDEERLIELLKKQPSTVTIKNELYEEGGKENLKWFRLSHSIDTPFSLKTISLEWSNSNLDFLLTSSEFKLLLSSKSLLYCYCYNQSDCMEQSNTRIDYFTRNHPNEPFKVTKNHLGDDIIDTSEHWGRYVKVQDLIFMAAPLMWFGGSFFQIITRDELLSFEESSIVDFNGTENVYVMLFDLYDDPSKKENREVQKNFGNSLICKVELKVMN